MIKKQLLGIALVSGVLLLPGCASVMNPIGDAKFDCNRKQDAKSPYCRSFKSVEASTTGAIPPSRFDKEFRMSDMDRAIGIAPDEEQGTVPEKDNRKSPDKPMLLPHQVRLEPSLVGAPVREAAVIQRVWIKRFVDGRDLLTENTTVYKEIRGTRWVGFDGSKNRMAAQIETYPHRVVESMSANTGIPPETESPTSTEFSQPGTQAAFSEAANDPAESGQSTSMPQ
jgi:hypothetical protein